MTINTIREDSRRFTRIPFDSQVRVVNSDGSWTSKLLDISLKGILISKPENWNANINDHFLIELILDGSDFQIRMDGSVVHLEGDHVGFRCEHIDLDSITHLRRLVELNVGNTEILNRELAALGV